MTTLYGIIDTAQDERLYRLVTATPDHHCLFAGTLAPDLARAAPYLVDLDTGTDLAEAWQTDGRTENWGIQCTSSRTLADMRRHFRQFLEAKLPDGSVVLFRFYDPRVWRTYVTACSPNDLAPWFKDVTKYQAYDASGRLRTYPNPKAP